MLVWRVTRGLTDGLLNQWSFNKQTRSYSPEFAPLAVFGWPRLPPATYPPPCPHPQWGQGLKGHSISHHSPSLCFGFHNNTTIRHDFILTFPLCHSKWIVPLWNNQYLFLVQMYYNISLHFFKAELATLSNNSKNTMSTWANQVHPGAIGLGNVYRAGIHISCFIGLHARLCLLLGCSNKESVDPNKTKQICVYISTPRLAIYSTVC